MDYLFAESNRFCRIFGHRYGRWYMPEDFEAVKGGARQRDALPNEDGARRTCSLCGHSETRS